MNRLDIRYATADDASTLSELGAETFWDAYHSDPHLEEEFIRAHIRKTFDAGRIAAELERDDIVYLLACGNDGPVGYARLLPGSTRKEIEGESALEISRIYLRKKHWGAGLGGRLLTECVADAARRKCDVIWLSVWEHNRRAIAFYEKQGFRLCGEHIFDLAGSPQVDFLMEKIVTGKQ